MPRCDAVVIGAGIAGLVAATRLAKSGKKTILIEKNSVPGGAATSFVRGRFEFDISASQVEELGTTQQPGKLREILKDLGVEPQWLPVTQAYHYVSTYSDGKPLDVKLPTGKVDFIRKVVTYVMDSGVQMQKLFALCEETVELLDYARKNPLSGAEELREKFPEAMRYAKQSTLSVLKDALKIPQKAIDILTGLWWVAGVDYAHLDFSHFALVLWGRSVTGTYAPQISSNEITMRLTQSFVNKGGSLWCGCKAEKIVFDELGNACAVDTNMGRIDCTQILADINPDILFGKMIESPRVPVRQIKLSTARQARYSQRMFTAYIGLDKDPVSLGVKDYITVLGTTSDTAKEKLSTEKFDTNAFSVITCPNVINPSASPKGTSILRISTFYGKTDWAKTEEKDYKDTKSVLLEKFITNAESRLGLEIKGHIEEIEIATPWTFARQLGTPEGCVMGFEPRGFDSLFSRMETFDEDNSGIHGLRCIGAGSSFGGGYYMSILSGDTLAKDAIAEMHKAGKR